MPRNPVLFIRWLDDLDDPHPLRKPMLPREHLKTTLQEAVCNYIEEVKAAQQLELRKNGIAQENRLWRPCRGKIPAVEGPRLRGHRGSGQGDNPKSGRSQARPLLLYECRTWLNTVMTRSTQLPLSFALSYGSKRYGHDQEQVRRWHFRRW